MVPGDQHIRLPSAEELDHLFEAGSELACVAGSPLILEDAHQTSRPIRSAYLVPLAIWVGTDSARS